MSIIWGSLQHINYRKRAFYVANTLSNLTLCLLASCQQVTELRVTQSGSTTPRNHREQTIFDYFHAFKQKRCVEALSLRAESPYSSYQTAKFPDMVELSIDSIKITAG
jgi:hypothetical protein